MNGDSSHRVRLQNAVLALKRLQARVDALEAAAREPVAIIGIGCRLPGGVETPAAFWRLLHDGLDTAGELPRDRWDAGPLLDTEPYTPGKMFTRYGNFLRDIDRFDPQFFGIAPREAATLDPQQRLLLEVSWEALEDAGQAPDALAGSRTGVFIGVSVDDYAQFHLRSGDYARIDAYTCSGAGLCFGAGRLSYVLGLQGPCMTLDTACSSGLTGVHLAVQSLRARECDLALVGGVNLILTPEVSIGMSALRALSPDGRSKAFDASADGFGRGEACAVVVLKRLADAVAGRDRVLGIVRGSAINHDGASGGLMVPNGLAQQSLLRDALARADVRPAEVQYIEAHGTGTALGDPIELEALAAVMAEDRPPARPLLVGSVKTNVGHPEAASGIVGLIKILLALQHEVIPPHLHFRQPSPHVPWDRLPIVVPTSPVPWPAGGGRRIAGVSAFGMSGTNVHVLLEEAPPAPATLAGVERPVHLLRLSAKTPAALRESAARLDRHLAEHSELALADVCFTANVGRSQFAHRAFLVAESTAEARTRLAAVASGQEVPGVWSRQAERGERPKVAFLFTGQGSQYAGMGRQLYATQPTYRMALERCDEILRPLLERPLLDVLFGAPSDIALLDQTEYTQPCLFAVEYALSELWRSWGVEPVAALGYSVGEYVAACVAGTLSLEDGLKLVSARARLMQSLPADGMMAAVLAGESHVAPALARYAGAVAIAAINGPTETVISGSREVVLELLPGFQAAGITVQPLNVSHAFHSPLIDPMLGPFAEIASQVRHQPARIGLVSNLTGRLMGGGVPDAEYWRRHAREPVQFVAGLGTLRDEGVRVFIEVGPRPTLSGIGRRAMPDGGAVWLPSLRPDQDEWRQMLYSLGLAHLHGVRVDWAGFDRDYPRQRVALPTYPFQRSRFPVTPPSPKPSPSGGATPLGPSAPVLHPLLHRRLDLPLREQVFEVTLSADAPAYLADHRVQGAVVFPATAYVEMVLEAARAAYGPGPHQLEAIRFEEALVFADDGVQTLQVVLSPDTGSVPRFEICARGEDGRQADAPAWRRLASGRLRPDATGQLPAVGLEAARERCGHELVIPEYYERFAGLGIDYGERFRALRGVRTGSGEAVARVALSDDAADEASSYHCHPALLDAALQVTLACVPEALTERHRYMPVGMERVSLRRPMGASGWSHAALRPGTDAAGASADITIFDDSGDVAVVVEGLRVEQITDSAVRRELEHPFYDVQWRQQELAAPAAELLRRRWLLVPDEGDLAARLASRLIAAGATCDVATDASAEGWHTYDGVVYLAGLNATVSESSDAAQVLAAAVAACDGALRILQAIAGMPAANRPRVWLATRGAQAVAPGRPVAAAQTALWGLGATVVLEQPDVRCTLVDLDPDEADPAAALAAELTADTVEDRVGFRAGRRHVARLSPRSVIAPRAADDVLELAQSERGVLDSLAWRAAAAPDIGPDQVLLRVHATPLNFRDVLNALGMYPGEAGPLGDECAAIVAAVGADVVGLEVGDEVVALASGSFRTHLAAHPALVVPRPAALAPEAASVLPIVYLTALYGLRDLARLLPGERVLVHAAAGGVGLAAVHVAHALGAEVFATAGSAEKRAFLAAQGVPHVFDSRAVSFADGVLERTGGSGVHVVLNSLAGEFIPASLRVLADNGRFVEIGKRDIWSAEQVAGVHSSAEYHPFHLGTLMATDPMRVRELLIEILEAVAAGKLPMLPHHVFEAADVQSAFRHMAQARHIGKIVVAQRRPVAVRKDRTYLVTGGMGALGRRAASWLVERGARHVVLVGRNAGGAGSQESVRELEAAGARVMAAAADVASRDDVVRLLADVGRSMPPLGGILHAAGVLDDGVLSQQDRARLTRVMAPKVAGAWNLHALTREHPLDFFVLFSSIVAIAGSAAQANYGAANAFLDGLAHYRRSLGLPATCINWGAWADTGMAAELSGRDRRRWTDQGIIPIPPQRGLAAMAALLAGGAPQASVVPIRWSRFLEQFPPGAMPPLYSEVHESRGGGPDPHASPRLLDQLRATPPNLRRRVLGGHIAAQVARALGIDRSEAIDPQQPLSELGLDSLMAVEIRNVLGTHVDQVLPVSLLYDYPTTDALTGFLAQQLPQMEWGDAPRPAAVGESGTAASLHTVSEAEAEALLLKELQALESMS